MVGPNEKTKGFGTQGRGGGGFSFGDREGRGRGRDGGGRGGGDKRQSGPGGGAAYRVVNELSALEKALTKTDYAAQKQALESVLKGIKSLRLKSLADMELGARGKVLTSLMRVIRQPKKDVVSPAGEPAQSASPPTESAPPENAATDSPASDTAASDTAASDTAASDTAASDTAASDTAAAENVSGEGVAGATAAQSQNAVEQTAPASRAPVSWSDAVFAAGMVWRAANEEERARAAFEAAGRQPTAADLASLSVVEAAVAEERPRRGNRRESTREGTRRPDRRSEQPRRREHDRPRPEGRRPERHSAEPSSGDWALDARTLEESGRTRDAGRIHEQNKSFAEASRLFEVGGDLKSALRNAARAQDASRISELSAKLTPDDVTQQLEKAEAWELLMELYVQKQDFGKVAGLYERALQFDQAALAWERAGKLSLARRCYEKAKDFASANRVREVEVKKLIERGDRLGAATLLMGVGRNPEAIELLKALPGPKAYAFMLKLKLSDEAQAFASEALAKAEAENNLQVKARWLETLGRIEQAAETYLAANRKDRASVLFDQLGQTAKAAELAEAAGQLDKAQALYAKANDLVNVERVKALPRPEPKSATHETEAKDEMESDEGHGSPATPLLAETPDASPSVNSQP